MQTQALGVKTAGDLRRFIAILLGAGAIAILLTCATVANLLLVRSERRQHELAVRTALGAGRWRVCRLLFVESLGIGLGGGLAGVGVAMLALSLLGSFALPGQIAIRELRLSVDVTTCAVCAGIGLVTALVFGIAPILQTGRVDAARTLRSGVRATDRQPLRTLLVGVQVALCVVLLGGSFAFGRAIVHALALDFGFNVAETSMTAIDPSLARLPSERASQVRKQALELVRARPAVRGAAWALMRPMSGAFIVNPVVEGAATAPDAKPLDIQANVVTDGYFETMQIPLVAGRAFTPQDAGSAERSAVVSAALAKTLWPDDAAIGHRFSLEERGAPDMKWTTVVGVVGDIHRAIGGPPVPMLYLISGQTPEGFTPNHLFVRSTDDPSAVLPEIRAVLRGIDPHVVVTSSIPMTRHVEAPLMTHRLGLTLFMMFAGLAIALTGFGLYAVIATAVSQRRREIGIRIALGAESAGIVAMVVRQGVWPIAAGLAAGIATFAMSARVIQGFMFSLPALSAATLLGICASVGVLAAVAMALPVRRALSVDPTTILHAE
jgi:predicted permease